MQPVSTNMGACVAVYTRSSCFTYVTAVNRMRIMPILGLTLDRAKPIIYQDVGTRFTNEKISFQMMPYYKEKSLCTKELLAKFIMWQYLTYKNKMSVHMQGIMLKFSLLLEVSYIKFLVHKNSRYQ